MGIRIFAIQTLYVIVEIGLSARGPNIIILQYDLHIMFDNAADCMLCVMHMLFGSI